MAVYGLFAILQIAQKPGIHYDEALLATGAVHMLHQPHREFALPHDPGSWIRVRSRWFPLMTLRYAGAIKEYLAVPLFAIFGTRTAMVRILSMLLGAIGIWGVGTLLRFQGGAKIGGLTALAIAVNPTYVAMTAFDNGTVAVPMAALGLLCLSTGWYLHRSTTFLAFLVGVTAGFGLWARANMLWAYAAMAAAVVIVLRRRILKIPLSHWVAASGGAVAGGLPLLIYQITSHGGTYEALGMFAASDEPGQRLWTRLVLFSESLLSDREHRAMWDGPFMGWWQRWLLSAVVAAASAACLRMRARMARIVALSFLIFAITLFASNLTIAEHHLVMLLPFAAALTVMAAPARWPGWTLGIFYAGCALQWQIAAIAGLNATGGVGTWSDSVEPLAARLERDFAKRTVRILDWGLQNNLYLLTQGRLQTVEIYGYDRSAWKNEMAAGGVYLYFTPKTTSPFLQAVAEMSPATRWIGVPQRDRRPWAELLEVKPNTLHQGGQTKIAMEDPRFADRLEGFYGIEDGRWRWSQRNFAIAFYPPGIQGTPARLTLQGYLPETVIQKVGAVKLSAQVNTHAVKPEVYPQAGGFTFVRELPAEWLGAGGVRVEFAVDKSVNAGGREVGIVVASASLEAAQ